MTTHTPRARLVRNSRVLRRADEIMDAAARVFAERGYHGTNVPEVAAAAGVGIGSLYRYFADKEALVNEVYRDAKLRLRAALLDGLAAPLQVGVAPLDVGEHPTRWLALLLMPRRCQDIAASPPKPAAG